MIVNHFYKLECEHAEINNSLNESFEIISIKEKENCIHLLNANEVREESSFEFNFLAKYKPEIGEENVSIKTDCLNETISSSSLSSFKDSNLD